MPTLGCLVLWAGSSRWTMWAIPRVKCEAEKSTTQTAIDLRANVLDATQVANAPLSMDYERRGLWIHHNMPWLQCFTIEWMVIHTSITILTPSTPLTHELSLYWVSCSTSSPKASLDKWKSKMFDLQLHCPSWQAQVLLIAHKAAVFDSETRNEWWWLHRLQCEGDFQLLITLAQQR